MLYTAVSVIANMRSYDHSKLLIFFIIEAYTRVSIDRSYMSILHDLSGTLTVSDQAHELAIALEINIVPFRRQTVRICLDHLRLLALILIIYRFNAC